jgi:hypothetical protein
MSTFATRQLTNDSTTASTVTPWIPLDPNIHPFAVSFAVILPSAVDTFAFSVQHTLHGILTSANFTADAVAFDHSTVSGKSANIDGNYAFPIAGIRLISLSASGTTPKANFLVRQAGIV